MILGYLYKTSSGIGARANREVARPALTQSKIHKLRLAG